MSKIEKWKYHEIFGYRLHREKLINMLICEIIFLKNQIKTYHLTIQSTELYEALKKLEYLLNLLRNNTNEISNTDFDKVISFIYSVFKNIVDNM